MGYNTKKMCEIKFTAIMHTNYRQQKIAEQEKFNKAKIKASGSSSNGIHIIKTKLNSKKCSNKQQKLHVHV